MHPGFHGEMASAALFILTLAIIEIIVCLLPAWTNSAGIPHFVTYHTFMETISIVISMMVFLVGWNTHRDKISGNIVLLSCVFFYVGVIDFSHTASYFGMPDFISPNDPEKNIIFWLLARLLAALVLLTVSVRDWKPLDSLKIRNLIFVLLTALALVFNWTVIVHQSWFPATFVNGQGLTHFKKNFEYVIIAINLSTAAILLTKLKKPQPFNIVLLLEAATVMAMSEYFFTIYSTMKGSYNAMGHIYKVIAYYLIYRAIVVQVIEDPYKELQQAEELLLQTNRELEDRVIRRTKDLKEANETLDKAHSELKKMQNELIQREKVAALGSLVAGISHELNTLLGNAILMSSSMLNQLEQLKEKMCNDTLKRSELADWQTQTAEMAQLCDRSINRAATLVASFKQVAIDQTSEQRRTFDLHKNIEDLLATIRPGLSGAQCMISNEIPSGIECDTFPGPLGQVIGNLLQNAVVHGFNQGQCGHIVIAAQTDQGQVALSVTDDGVGMQAATLAHIFDPFFTTKLGKGGSGLGLTVCHRIVTSILGGDIHVVSKPGSGTRFVLSIPLTAPGKL